MKAKYGAVTVLAMANGFILITSPQCMAGIFNNFKAILISEFVAKIYTFAIALVLK